MKSISPFILSVLLVILAVVALYSQKLDNQFVFDDTKFIVEADAQKNLANIPGFFLSSQHRLYRPLRSTAYTLVRNIGGLNPLAHHVAGIFFHLATVLFLFALILQLTRSLRTATLSALLIGLHPMAVSKAGHMTASFDMAGVMFGYAALPFFLTWLRQGTVRTLAMTFVLLALGLAGSEEAATVPLLMILIASAEPPDPARRKRLFVALVPAFCILAVYLVLRSHFVPGFSRIDHYVAGGLSQTISTMAVVFWRYVRFALLPVGMAAVHFVPLYPDFTLIPILSLLGILVLVFLALINRTRRPMVFIGIGWLFIGLAPFSNLIPLDTLFAERYAYCGQVGILILAGYGFDRLLTGLSSRLHRSIAWVAIGLVLAAFFLLSSRRIEVWHDEKSLWADSLARQPETYIANINYAHVLYSEGKIDQALSYLSKAAAMDPAAPAAYVNMGNLLHEKGLSKEAKAQYLTALQKDPEHTQALEGLAQVHLALGEFPQAYERAIKVLAQHPDNGIALNAAASVLAMGGHCDRAVPLFQRLLQTTDDEGFQQAARANIRACESRTNINSSISQ